jgi:hypothetical protein
VQRGAIALEFCRHLRLQLLDVLNQPLLQLGEVLAPASRPRRQLSPGAPQSFARAFGQLGEGQHVSGFGASGVHAQKVFLILQGGDFMHGERGPPVRRLGQYSKDL